VPGPALSDKNPSPPAGAGSHEPITAPGVGMVGGDSEIGNTHPSDIRIAVPARVPNRITASANPNPAPVAAPNSR
jgi:hypothetical protein